MGHGDPRQCERAEHNDASRGELRRSTSQTIGGNPPVGFFFINGALNLGGNNATVASIKSSANSGTAIVQNASGTPATITIIGSTSMNFAGIVQDGVGGGSLSLIKQAPARSRSRTPTTRATPPSTAARSW